jgi:hypothetical protein
MVVAAPALGRAKGAREGRGRASGPAGGGARVRDCGAARVFYRGSYLYAMLPVAHLYTYATGNMALPLPHTYP